MDTFHGGGGAAPLYKSHRFVPPQKVWFLLLFGLKTGINFAHFGLVSGMVFKGTTGVYVSIPYEQERNRYANSKRFLRNLFVCVLI